MPEIATLVETAASETAVRGTRQALCMNAVRVGGKGEWVRCQTTVTLLGDEPLETVECPGCLRKGMLAPLVHVPKPEAKRA